MNIKVLNYYLGEEEMECSVKIPMKNMIIKGQQILKRPNRVLSPGKNEVSFFLGRVPDSDAIRTL